jgi:tetratricopeptide (TPR) repeat protein
MPSSARRERYIFFLTPIFLIFFGIALCYEIGLSRAVETGIGIGGTFSIVFLGAGSIFWVISRLFRLPHAPESYWQAGMFTLVHLLACIFLTYCLELVFLGPVIEGMGPMAYNEARMTILAGIYLPTLFSGILAVSARARLKLINNHKSLPWQKFLFHNAVVIIPLAAMLLGAFFLAFQPVENRALIKARIFHEAGGVERAIVYAEKGLAEKEDFAPLHHVLGSAIIDAAVASFTPAQALYHLQRAVSLVPNNALYLYKLSIAHDIEHNYDKAVEAASQAVSLQPDDAFLWQHLGELNLRYRNLEQAVHAYRGALKLEPESPTLLNNLAYTCLELNKDLPQALELAKKSVEMLPGFVFNSDTLAWAYYKNGRYAEALEVMNSMYEDRTELSIEVDFHYAMILHANGLLAEPVKAIEKLLARPEAISDKFLYRQISSALDEIRKKDSVGKGEAPNHE